jgi:meso-butanediol dehydrogenase / (S,S)-butanediol dehydrogenase / diacetyl reductase
MAMRVNGKTVVVAGAAGGMGRAVARLLLDEGASVVLVDRDEKPLEALEAELPAGRRASSVVCDLTDEDQVRDLAARLDIVDGLLNLQGIAPFAAIGDTTTAQWRAVLDANLSSVFLTCREIGGMMARRGMGSIVNVASTAGLFGVPQMAAYTAAKHGVVGLTRALAVELGEHGVRVNCICPGATLTPMLMTTPDSYRAARTRRVPLGRLADPADQAAVAMFLISDDSAYLSGAAIPVDGGISAVAPGTAEESIHTREER